MANVGILYSDESRKGLTHPFFSLILDAVFRQTRSRGYNLTFINPEDVKGPDDLAKRCVGIDGVCLVCVDFASPDVRGLVDSGIPCVTIDHIYRKVPAVLSDNETGVQKLVEYAISMGHRRIAFIHGHNNSLVTRTRISQFRNTMAYHGIPVPAEYVREGLYNEIALTRRLVEELLRLPEPPTCILLPDDITFLGAQQAAWAKGLRIPEDISFAGYDCIPTTQALMPPLATIRQSCEEIGRTAATRLIDLIESPDTASRKANIFPVELIEGGTVARIGGA